MPYRSILCPVDFSDHSRLALRYAVGLAGRDRAQLTVLSVNDLLLVEAAAAAYDAAYVQKETESGLRDLVLSVIPGGASWAPVPRLIVKAGAPVHEIVEVARREEADLIVMGTHGLGGYRKMFFGSVAQGVLRHASVPVLAVPTTEFPIVQLARTSPVFSVGRVMVPLDLADDPESAARSAADVARSFGVPLVLAHVVPQVSAPTLWRDALQVQQRIRVARAREQLERLAAALSHDLVVDVRVGVGRPADEVAALAAESQAGLIVMELKGRGGLLDAKPGSIAYRVLCLAQVPVLTLQGIPKNPA
jgi:nucleotide-binding universal stress UspA family protein